MSAGKSRYRLVDSPKIDASEGEYVVRQGHFDDGETATIEEVYRMAREVFWWQGIHNGYYDPSYLWAVVIDGGRSN